MLCLDEVYIGYLPNHDEKFLTCLSSATRLCSYLSELMAACCDAVKFSRLVDLVFQSEVDWLEPLIYLLENSPKLKTLTLSTAGCPLSSWNQPSTIPGCLSSHLEIVRWKDYEGKEDEKQLMTYILANSRCLKTVEVSLVATSDLEKCQKECHKVAEKAVNKGVETLDFKLLWGGEPTSFPNPMARPSFTEIAGRLRVMSSAATSTQSKPPAHLTGKSYNR
ncbi:unnamed protein product [Microthlaspi erraticum]|uniref:FBD domain-containing protein n=1 Tax=Microthlaspi erraticum TaxID=1685480 RepID=A0A6D2L641_9BRAS|nr:unnamed protein product [Microthlaspi erraticum]CAA7062113.1 unnamed protein product [Microthlaspi erraticum]